MAFDEKKLRAAAAAILSPRPDFKAMRGNADTLAEFVAEMTDDGEITISWLLSIGAKNFGHSTFGFVFRQDSLGKERILVIDCRDAFVSIEIIDTYDNSRARWQVGKSTRGDVNRLLFALSKGTP